MSGAIRDFLQRHFNPLADDECVEFRAFENGGERAKHRVFTRDLEYAETWCQWADQSGYHVYYGIASRKAESRSGRKEDLRRSWYVWADLDAKDYDGGKDEALRRIRAFALPPTAIVDSGGGFQSLWRLDRPVQGDDLPALERIVAGLARFLESDPSVKDATRIFRVPGTHNHKPHFAIKPLVTVEYPEGDAYTLFDFAEIFPIEAPRPAIAAPPPFDRKDAQQEEAVRSALEAIDPWSLSYQDWVRCLMALHSAYPDDYGLSLAESWAQGKKGEVAAKWRTFDPAKTTNVSTIFYFAKEAGWVAPAPEYGEFIWEPTDPKANAGADAEPDAPGELRFLPLPEFLMADFPAPEWLVDQLLMTASTSLLVAKPKVGKSTLAANLAFAIAGGLTFLDRAVKQGPVYVLSLDQEPGPMQAQYDALVADLLEEGATLPPIAIHAQYALGHGLFAQVAEVLREHRPALLVVDTLTKLVNIQDGNSYSEVPRALAPYSELATETGTHICFLHHAHKGVADGADVTMGSVGFTGAVGTIMVLKKDPASGLTTFEATQRWAPEIPETVIEFHPISRSVQVLGDRDRVTREEAGRRIIGLLALGDDFTASEIKAQLAPLPEIVAGLALGDLVAQGRIRKSEDRPARYKALRWHAPATEPGPTQQELGD